MERRRKRNFESASDISDLSEHDEDDDERADNPAINNAIVDHAHVQLRRKIMSVICGLMCVMNIFIVSRNLGAAELKFLPVAMSKIDNFSILEIVDDEIFLPAIKFQQDLWLRIIAMDKYCVDPTCKSEQGFWDTYRGREEDWYKECHKSTGCLPPHLTQ